MLHVKDLFFRHRTVTEEECKPSVTDLDGTKRMACHASLMPGNAGYIIIVVEMRSAFTEESGRRVEHRFNYYTYHGNGDYNRLPNLRAAYMNGRRIDMVNEEEVSSVYTEEVPVDER